MKILIICNYSAGLYLFRSMLIQELINQNHTVFAVVPKSNDEYELKAECKLKEIGCKLIYSDIDRRGINPIKDVKLFLQYRNIINDITPNMVITYTIKPNIYGGIACELTRVPYVVNVTGLGTAFENKGIVKKIVCSLYKIALKNAKIVFFENSENRDIVVNLGLVKKEKTIVLPGAGVDLEKFSYVDFPKYDSETRFLFIGRVMKEKGIEELLVAVRRLVNEGYNCSLYVVGWLEENYLDILKKYENEGWLHYCGVHDDVRPFIANCHCFVLPSWHEGMANTNLECASSGRPIITSKIHGCLEAVVDGESGYLIEIKNSDMLYETMKRFICLPHETKAIMGLRGRQYMSETFDKKSVVKYTIDHILKSLM